MIARLSAWWFAPAPAERLAALRILIGGFALVYVAGRLPELVAVARYGDAQFAPIGVVRVLGAPLPAPLPLVIALVTCALLAAFVAGVWYRVTAPLAAAALLWTLTYRNCWGQVFHTENLMVLHVIALACAPAADAWAVRRGPAAPAPAGYGWAIKLLVALTAATYVLAGVAKLRLAGLDWLDGAQLRNQIAIDNLRKALLGDWTAPLATPLLEHPSWFVVASLLTLIVELGAPIALCGGRVARLWAVSAWGFHVGVVLLMMIWFPYPLLGLAFLPIVRAERVISAMARVGRGIRNRAGR
jgi:hypothetical protein